MRFVTSTLIGAAFALGLVGAAQAETYTLDKSHTAIHFTVDHVGYSLTHGFFTEFDAEIEYDIDKPEDSSVVFTIDATSVNTLWPARDKHVRAKDFLDVRKHAEIVFESKEIEVTGEDTAKLTGDLTIVGVTKEQEFEVLLRKSAPSPFDSKMMVVGFQVTGVIDRTDFGISYAVPAVGAGIPVQIDLEINRPLSGS